MEASIKRNPNHLKYLCFTPLSFEILLSVFVVSDDLYRCDCVCLLILFFSIDSISFTKLLGKYQMKQKGQHYITVIIATRIFLEWFGLNVQFVRILTFVSSAFLLELKFLLTRAIIHTGLWLVAFFRVTFSFVILAIQAHCMIADG